MRKTALLLLALVCCSLTRTIAADNATELKLSNCKSTIVAYLSVSRSLDSGQAALYFPAETMAAYKGCQIASINVGVMGKTEADALRVFITDDLNGDPIVEKSDSASKGGWTTVTLDEPYTITGEAIYVGYELSGFLYLSVCEPFIAGEEWVNITTNGWQQYDGVYSAALEAIVTGDSLPLHNVYLKSIYMPGYATTGEAATYSGRFINLAAEPVNSLTLTYYKDGTAAMSETISVDTTEYRSTGSFTSSYTPDEEGNAEMQVVISAVNGGDDVLPSDNSSRSKPLLVRDSFTERNILLEVFSTELCVNCASAHSLIESTYEDYDNIIEVGHHAGYYTDSYSVDESVEYEWFYNTVSTFAPALMYDRSWFDNYESLYSNDGSPITSPDDETLASMYSEAASVPAYVTVNVTPEYDEQTRHLALTVEGEQLLPADDYDDLRLNVFVLEDSIFTTTQKNTSGSFYHRYSLRSVLSSVWGDSVDIADGYSATYETDIVDTIDIDQVYVVAFIANYDSSSPDNCPVLNSARVKITEDNSASGITTATTAEESHVQPAAVYDLSGRRVTTGTAADNLQPGTYIMRSTNGKSRKVVIGR